MFGRGNWAVLGLSKDSLETFTQNLDDRRLMIATSQLAASVVTRHIKVDAIGLNPFAAPRLDELHPLPPEAETELARFAASDLETRINTTIPEDLLQSEGYGVGSHLFQLHDSLPWFGLWAVANQWKDISDLASVKEQHSYSALERPYKFLQTGDKKTVDNEIRGITAAVRKQFAVLLDFNEGRVYLESTGKKAILAVVAVLKQLGLEIIPLAWSYSTPNWPAEILNRLHKETNFGADLQKRAEESTRFRPKEIEKLEDKEVESVVANFFSMTELPSSIWVGITTPAQIRLHSSSQPIGVRSSPTATTLLGLTEEAHILSGSLRFQDRITFHTKKGEERTFRKDLLTLDLNDQINLTDAGAALLRGFDLPAYRKDILREIKQSKQVPSIEEFWGTWLHQMSNAVRTIESSFREILQLESSEKAGLQPTHIPSSEELLEVEEV